jgi:hypothetical protein
VTPLGMPPARPVIALAACAACFASNQLVEVAALTAGGFVLYEQGKLALIELLEPVVPLNRLQRLRAAVSRKIQANHARILCPAGAAHTSRCCAALLCPLPDLLMTG